MPIHCTKSGCKYGKKGKLYKGKTAKAKAARQGRAIKANQRKR